MNEQAKTHTPVLSLFLPSPQEGSAQTPLLTPPFFLEAGCSLCTRHASRQPPHMQETSPNPSSALPDPSTHVSISVRTILPTLCLPLPPAHKSCPSSHPHILKPPCSCFSQCCSLGFRITRVLIPAQALCSSPSSDDVAPPYIRGWWGVYECLACWGPLA